MLSQTINNILPSAVFYFNIAPLLLLLLAALSIMLIGAFSSPLKPNKKTFFVAILTLSAAIICPFLPYAKPGEFLTGSVVFDSISAVSLFIISIGTLFTLICASSTKAGKNLLRSELTALLLFASSGLMIITLSGEIISFFIGLEITSLALYVLVGYSHPNGNSLEDPSFRQTRFKSLEASIKYFLLGSGASAVILMGSALLYAHLGSLKFQNFHLIDYSNPFALLGFFFILCGIAFKLGLAPFHSWVPDVYQGANAHLTGYMASLFKFSLVIVLMRILSMSTSGMQVLPILFCILGVASIVIGSLFGLVQNSLKRLLAYSSVANVGYFCLAFASLAKDPSSIYAKQSLFIYAFIYAVLSLGAFHVIAWFEDGQREDIFKEELAGIGRTRPFPAFALSVFLFGLAGIPPLAGFFGKLILIITAVQSGLTWFAIVLVVFSCFSLYYYLNLMVDMWFKAPTRYTASVKSSKKTNVIMGTMSMLAIVIVMSIGLFGI